MPNGADARVPMVAPADRPVQRDRWLAKWAATRPGGVAPEHLAVFFASWHPPNLAAANIILWLAPDLPEVQFVLGGSHGDAFADDLVPANVVFTGRVGERVKRTLLGAADVALKPMLQGSGTNLKVIEYLAAGVPVVSTRFGVRGLEVIDGTHVLVAEPHEMVDAMRAVLADPAAATTRAAAGRALALDRYDWTRLGEVLAEVVRGALTHRADRVAG
ncbi:hypothetical protein BH10ACT1_BH10ACT1_43240 [soil metagenome]